MRRKPLAPSSIAPAIAHKQRSVIRAYGMRMRSGSIALRAGNTAPRRHNRPAY